MKSITKTLTKLLFYWYAFKQMNTNTSNLRKSCGPQFTKVFRAILYSPRLTWGAKCLCLAVYDSPNFTGVKFSVLARRLGSTPAQVSIWYKELVNNKFATRPQKGKIPGNL